MHLEIENIHHPQIKNMNLSVYDVGYRAAHLHPEIELIDRTCCGVTKDVICRRIWKVTEGKETLKLRFILDRQSIELFVNDGEQVVTTAICTPMEADEIVFSCDGKAKVNVEKYEIVV